MAKKYQSDAIKVGGVMSFFGILLYMYGHRKSQSIQAQIAQLDIGATK